MKLFQRIGLSVLVVGTLASLAIYAWRQRSQTCAAPPTVGPVAPLAAVEEDTPTRPEPLVEDARAVVEGEEPSAEGEGVELAGQAQAPDPGQMKQLLLSAVEESLLGVVNASDIVDAALELARRELDKRPPNETDPGGRLVYPLLATPEGVRAALTIQPANRTGHLGLSLRVQSASPEGGHLIQGYVRAEATADVGLIFDAQGSLMRGSIVTTFPPIGTDPGLDHTSGQVPLGVFYHVDVRDPLAWKASTWGLVDGQPGNLDSSPILKGIPAANVEKMKQLATLLQAHYHSLEQ